MKKWSGGPFLSHSDEENGHRACTNGHLTTADHDRNTFGKNEKKCLKNRLMWYTMVAGGKLG